MTWFVIGVIAVVGWVVQKIKALFRPVCVNPLCDRSPDRRHKH